MSTPEPILFCWSGGKDSAMALHTILQRDDVQVTALLTTVTEGYERISMHGVRRELLERQAQSIGLPLHEVRIPPQCVNPIYEARMEEALRVHYNQGVRNDRTFSHLEARHARAHPSFPRPAIPRHRRLRGSQGSRSPLRRA